MEKFLKKDAVSTLNCLNIFCLSVCHFTLSIVCPFSMMRIIRIVSIRVSRHAKFLIREIRGIRNHESDIDEIEVIERLESSGSN